nr:hypothetical protein [Sorangium cellulosum]
MQEDVRRLQVPVDDVRRVHRGEAPRHVAPDRRGHVRVEPAPALEQIRERLSREQLHHEERLAELGLAHVVHVDDVAVPQRPAIPPLALEPPPELGIRPVDQFQRHLARRGQVERGPHHPHGALAEPPHQLVLLGDHQAGSDVREGLGHRAQQGCSGRSTGARKVS